MKIKSLLFGLVLALVSVTGITASARYSDTAVPYSLDGGTMLIEEGFVNTGSVEKYGMTDWELNVAAGSSFVGWGEYWFSDTNQYAPVSLTRKFRRTTDETNLTLVWRMKLESYFDGLSYQINDGDTSIVSVATKGGKLVFEQPDGNDIVISENYTQECTSYRTLRIEMNQQTKRAAVYYRGDLITSDARFLTDKNTADRVYIRTTDAAVGKCYIATLDLFYDYFVNERAIEVESSGTAIPDSMTYTQNGGTITAKSALIGRFRQNEGGSFQLDSNASAAKVSAKAEFSERADWVTYDWQFYQKTKQDGFVVNVGDGIAIKTMNGGLAYKNASGNWENFYPSYFDGVIYRIRINANYTTNCYDIYLNGNPVKKNVPMSSANYGYIEFTAEPGAVLSTVFDKIEVFPRTPEPENYVPEPKVANSNDIIGILSCSIWSSGQQSGWNSISAFPNREPLLGFYDAEKAEVADWETKWMAEHGIDYRIYCWFDYDPGLAPNYYQADDIEQGMKYSKYRDSIDYALMIENASSGLRPLDRFKSELLPYLVEHHFKSDNYMKIDNKPVISIYSINYFANQMAGLTKTAAVTPEAMAMGIAGVQAIRDACVDAGFDGAYIMCVGDGTAYGVDARHAYNYGRSSGDMEYQRNSMAKLMTGSSNYIPTAVMGWDSEPWDQQKGKFLTVAEYKELLTWIRDTYQKNVSTDNPGKNMLVVDNWNEYGEGHILAPIKEAGFGYLDAIREVFVGDEHTEADDVAPTDEQKERFTVKFDNTFRAKKIGGDGTVPTRAIESWDFNGADDGWAGWGITKTTTADSVLIGVNSGDPVFQSPVLEQNAGDGGVLGVKIRIKNATEATGFQVFFLTDTVTEYAETAASAFHVPTTDESGEFTEVYVDFSGHPTWKGVLQRIRIDSTNNANGKYWIDSIELMGEPVKDNNKVTFDGRDKSIEPQIIDEIPMLPYRAIMEACNMNVNWFGDIQTGIAVSKTNQDVVKVQSDANTLVKNIKTLTLDAPVRNLDGTLYVPLDFVRKGLGSSVGYDAENNIVKIVSNVVEFYFTENHLQGWTLNKNLSIPVLNTDNLTMTALGQDAIIVSPSGLNIAVDAITGVKLEFKNDTPAEFATLRFINTKGETGIATFEINSNDKNITEYTVELPSDFKGTIDKVEFVPTVERGEITLKSIQFAL